MNKKNEAIKLRKLGKSYNEISKKLIVPKSTLSYWFSGVDFSKELKQKIVKRSKLIWAKNITAYNLKRSQRIKSNHLANRVASAKEIRKISDYELKLIGTSLYWAEGGKRGNRFEFTNSDPKLIKIIIRFLCHLCSIQKKNIKAQINIHKNIDQKEALKYWRSITLLPKENFYKLMYYKNIASKNKRQKNRLPYGTIQLRVYDTSLFNKILGWINGINNNV